jgi:hypothetical protein
MAGHGTISGANGTVVQSLQGVHALVTARILFYCRTNGWYVTIICVCVALLLLLLLFCGKKWRNNDWVILVVSYAAAACIISHSFSSGYDGLKTTAKEEYGVEDGPLLHAMSSVSASFFASFCSAPADYVMARYMNSSSNASVTDCVRMIYKEGGIRGFWKGWSVFFIRLTPVLLTYSSVYEQLRYELGLGYMD